MELLKEFNLPQTALLLIGGIVIWLKLQALANQLDERHHNTEKRLDKIEEDIASTRANIHQVYQRVLEELAKAIGEIVRRAPSR